VGLGARPRRLKSNGAKRGYCHRLLQGHGGNGRGCPGHSRGRHALWRTPLQLRRQRLWAERVVGVVAFRRRRGSVGARRGGWAASARRELARARDQGCPRLLSGSTSVIAHIDTAHRTCHATRAVLCTAASAARACWIICACRVFAVSRLAVSWGDGRFGAAPGHATAQICSVHRTPVIQQRTPGHLSYNTRRNRSAYNTTPGTRHATCHVHLSIRKGNV
jgi:hypothetical protein